MVEVSSNVNVELLQSWVSNPQVPPSPFSASIGLNEYKRWTKGLLQNGKVVDRSGSALSL